MFHARWYSSYSSPGFANVFRKGPNINIFSFISHKVSITTTQLCHCTTEAAKVNTQRWVGLYSHKILRQIWPISPSLLTSVVSTFLQTSLRQNSLRGVRAASGHVCGLCSFAKSTHKALDSKGWAAGEGIPSYWHWKGFFLLGHLHEDIRCLLIIGKIHTNRK